MEEMTIRAGIQGKVFYIHLGRDLVTISALGAFKLCGIGHNLMDAFEDLKRIARLQLLFLDQYSFSSEEVKLLQLRYYLRNLVAWETS